MQGPLEDLILEQPLFPIGQAGVAIEIPVSPSLPPPSKMAEHTYFLGTPSALTLTAGYISLRSGSSES